jgi:hypothetical protein
VRQAECKTEKSVDDVWKGDAHEHQLLRLQKLWGPLSSRDARDASGDMGGNDRFSGGNGVDTFTDLGGDNSANGFGGNDTLNSATTAIDCA